MIRWGDKDPSNVDDYEMLWSDVLNVGETILTSVFTAPAGLTITSQAHTTNASQVRLSGGTAGVDYTLECTITTSSGRTLQHSVRLLVVDL